MYVKKKRANYVSTLNKWPVGGQAMDKLYGEKEKGSEDSFAPFLFLVFTLSPFLCPAILSDCHRFRSHDKEFLIYQ
ncbi:MAG: hypothetical protein JWO58_2998 [Chitinophagaceae bacterium]|nr:hypothetical protein [Chitinophagaceae bacterium]